MKRENISRAILIALLVAAGVELKWFSSAALTAHATQTQGRSLPTFEVDRAWPKVPPQWKLGDASSIAIDAQDNVWVLHRPRTLKPEQRSEERRVGKEWRTRLSPNHAQKRDASRR